MSENAALSAALSWAAQSCAIQVAEYVRRSQSLLFNEPPPVPPMPSACYRAQAGFIVHVRPACRCSR